MTFILEIALTTAASSSVFSLGTGVSSLLEESVCGVMDVSIAAMSEIGLSHPGGLDSASATKFDFPSIYLMSVVYSERHDSWYVCRGVSGSDFFFMEGTNACWSVQIVKE